MDWKKILEEATQPAMPQRRDFRIASAGSGFIVADCQQVAYQKNGFCTYAIASRKRENAQRVADRFGIPHVYDTWEEMLEDPAVEIVDIALPPHVQPQVLKKCVEQRSHIRGVLCQKPAAVTLDELHAMQDMCRGTGLKVAVNQNMRYDQSMRALKCALDAGLLGKPVMAHIDMRARADIQPFYRNYGRLDILDMGVHHIDVLRWLLGTPQKATAFCRENPHLDYPHRDGISQVLFQYEDGLMAGALDDNFAGSFACEQDLYIRWRVEGTEGTAEGAIGWPYYPELVPSTFRITSSLIPGGWLVPEWDTTWFSDAFAGTMASLLCAVEQDTEPEISLDDNEKTMACVEACYRSIDEERTVYLNEIL
ncbi:Gfo/Idh/MocA family protein [Butyricicoccus sp.]|uniref:Gfo/Idh/MocA family protein n=1 Tax=Butyricicoccus sp. TaxID=2049021 RepID=UPI003F151905